MMTGTTIVKLIAIARVTGVTRGVIILDAHI